MKIKETDMFSEGRHFEETIIEAISWCPDGASSGEIIRLMGLIRITVIPEGHDKIIKAIDKYFDFPGSDKWAREIRIVKESLLEKKRIAEEKLDKGSKQILGLGH